MSRPPNLLVIQTDQQSRWTLGAYGGTLVETPNIDRLAREGVRFENFFTNSAVCTPSRGCLVSSLYPHHHGAYHNDIELRRDVVTIAHILDRAGYETGYVGKWHLDGCRGGFIPPERSMGFADCRWMSEYGLPKSIIENPDGTITRSASIDEGRYPTDWHTDKVLEFLARERTAPFFCMVNVSDPHTPYTVREPYASMYRAEDMPVPPTFWQEGMPSWADPAEEGVSSYERSAEGEAQMRRDKAAYCGMVKCIDDNVGRILEALEAQGILDETIVVYTTDHGDYMGEHRMHGKNRVYEAVYRVPFLARWPAALRAGTVMERFFTGVDVRPTLLSLMGLELAGTEEGRDGSALLRGETTPWTDEAFFHHSHFWFTGVFTPDYELALHEGGEHVLFDRREDPDQVNNLAASAAHRDALRELAARVLAHNREVESPALAWIEKAVGEL